MQTVVVLPGDEIAAPWLTTNGEGSKKRSKVVGVGLEVSGDRMLVANVTGVLHETDNKIWVDSAETRSVLVNVYWQSKLYF